VKFRIGEEELIGILDTGSQLSLEKPPWIPVSVR
jgi:hypothetical protein